MDAEQLVAAFLTAIEGKDLDAAVALCAEDVVYDNVPFDPVEGHQGIRDTLGMLLPMADEIEWVVHRQLANATTVMNERTDRFRIDGEWKEIEVTGIFEVTDGRITLWRDYFDLDAFRRDFGLG